MKSCSLSVRIAAPVNFFFFFIFFFSMLHVVSGVGWGMHVGEEQLSKPSRLDVNV